MKTEIMPIASILRSYSIRGMINLWSAFTLFAALGNEGKLVITIILPEED